MEFDTSWLRPQEPPCFTKSQKLAPTLIKIGTNKIGTTITANNDELTTQT